MTFDANVPNGGQSPGLFPAQNNTNFTRLKTIINADHVFNDTGQDTDGIHRQMTLVDRDTPTVLLTGSNSITYGKLASDNSSDVWFYNGTLNNQLNWRELQGTCNMTSSFSDIVAIPANCYGYIYLFKDIAPNGQYVSSGTFASNNSVTNGYSYAEKFISGSGATQLIFLGFSGAGASALTLKGKNDNGSFYNGVWNYRAFYRLIA